MGNGKLYLGGIPYRLDVNRLKEAFPAEQLVEGLIIKHAEIDGIIEAKPKSARYYAVVNSWMREMLHTCGLYMIWEPKVGISVLAPDGVLADVETRVRRKAKQVIRTCGRMKWVDRQRLNPTGQARCDHTVRVTLALKESAENGAKNLAIELSPVKSLPKPKLLA